MFIKSGVVLKYTPLVIDLPRVSSFKDGTLSIIVNTVRLYFPLLLSKSLLPAVEKYSIC